MSSQDGSYLGGCCAEELAAQVDEVDSAVREFVVQAGFEADRVVAKDHGVHVIVEGDRCVAQFADPVERLQSPGHADLDHVGAEGADVGDDVDVPCADVGCAAVDAVDRVLDLGEPGFSTGRAVEVALVA